MPGEVLVGGYRIFLSQKYGDRDRPRIEAIAMAIRGLSPNVEVFNPSADIRHGQAWRPQLYEALRTSDMLLLVYTDPLDDWSWCTYEAGLFASLDQDPTDAEPTVCLHHPDAEPPRQLQHLQCVEARPAAVEAFLRTLFTTTDITRERWPLEVKLAPDELAAAAVQICAQFAVVDRYYATFRLVLDLSRDEACESGLPDSARVTDATPGTADLFGHGVVIGLTWGELTRAHRTPEAAAWLTQLDEAFLAACRREAPAPANARFHPASSLRLVRPVVYSIDEYDRRPVSAVLVFTDEVAPSRVGGRVFNILRTLERDKTELIDRFVDRSEPAEPTLQANATLRDVGDVLAIIDRETMQLGVFEPDVIQHSFPDPEVRDRFVKAAERWGREVSGLVEAIEADRAEQALASLSELGRVIDEMAVIAAERYRELVASRLGPQADRPAPKG